MAEVEDITSQDSAQLVDEITQSLFSVRGLLKTLKERQDVKPEDSDMRDGISLLSVKNHVMLSYIQSATLLLAHRALGHSLIKRSPPDASFASFERPARGNSAGDLVDHMVEGRLVLEKIKTLETRMKYQIEKLVRIATEPQNTKNVIDDPLVFRPNPQDLAEGGPDGSEDEQDADKQERSGIYRPPKLAPMPYTERKNDSRRLPVPAALSSLTHLDPSKPHTESTSGLGNMPSLTSSRTREIQEMVEWEEANMTRLVMKKRDEKKRRRDEADIALGGLGTSSGRRAGGFEEEFEDVLRSVSRTRQGVVGDGYEELRIRGKKADAFARSRERTEDDGFHEADMDDGPRQRKKSRFEKAVKAAKTRSNWKRSKHKRT